MMDDWLVRQLAVKSGAAPGTATLSTVICRGCHQKVLVGLSDDRAAFWVAVDPYALGAQGEALAQLAGRPTYALIHRGGFRLLHRDRWQIAGHRQLARTDIVAEHRCGAPLLPHTPSNHHQPPKVIDNAQCPY
jgi:hypothetical protein